MGLVYIFGAFFALLSIWILLDRWRLRKLRRQRQGRGLGRQQFIEAFRQRGVADIIPAAVFDYYSSLPGWRDFPFYPDDTYGSVLHDDPDDIDDDASNLVQRLGWRMPPEYIRREYDGAPIKTLQDMVLWLEWIRQRQSSSEPHS